MGTVRAPFDTAVNPHVRTELEEGSIELGLAHVDTLVQALAAGLCAALLACLAEAASRSRPGRTILAEFRVRRTGYGRYVPRCVQSFTPAIQRTFI